MPILNFCQQSVNFCNPSLVTYLYIVVEADNFAINCHFASRRVRRTTPSVSQRSEGKVEAQPTGYQCSVNFEGNWDYEGNVNVVHGGQNW